MKKLIHSKLTKLTVTAFILVAGIILAYSYLNADSIQNSVNKGASVVLAASADSSSEAKSLVASSDSKTTTKKVTTKKKVSLPKTIKFKKKKKKFKVGDTFKFKAVAKHTGKKVTYKVSNKKKASISQKGVFKAKDAGTVTVTAKSGSVRVRVKVKIKYKGIVCLDPGHSSVVNSGVEPIGPGSSTMKAKDNTGTCGNYSHVPEYKVTLTLAQKMEKILTKKGYKVVLTRTNNTTAVDCSERAKIATKANADIFIRLHCDSINSSYVKGASAHYPSTSNRYVGKMSSKCKKLSECVLNAMCKKTGGAKRGMFARDDLSGNNWATMPVTLIEVGFMSNPTEDMLITSDSYQNKLAQGMCDGIDDYFGY